VIGIKLANGEFYPVLNEDDRRARKMVLTTVRDDQNNVQIDLFRGKAHARLSETEYIASLVLENVRTAPRGELDIELNMNIDAHDNLNASAYESSSGERQSLSVSLEYLESSMFEFPELDVNEPEASSAPGEAERAEASGELFEEEPAEDDEPAEPPAPARSPLLLAGFLLVGLGIVAVLLYLVFILLKGDPVPALKAVQLGRP